MSSPLELDKQAGLPEVPYVSGWSAPRDLNEAHLEVKKLREAYVAKCVELDLAIDKLNTAMGEQVDQASKGQQRLDLAMLVRRLTKRTDPDDPVTVQALDYLKRHNLLGTPLRSDNGT